MSMESEYHASGRKRKRSYRFLFPSCERCYMLKKKCDKKLPCSRCRNTCAKCFYAKGHGDGASISPNDSPLETRDKILRSAIQKLESHVCHETILLQMRTEYLEKCTQKISSSDLEAQDYALPEFDVAMDIIRAYLHDHHVSYPFLDVEVLCENLLEAYDRPDTLSDHELYRLYMVFAVGSLIRIGRNSTSEYLESAINFYRLAHCITFHDYMIPKILIVERLMLDVAYFLFFPESSPNSLWDLIGLACRHLLGMGYYCEPPPELSIRLADMRKRQFWSVYKADRLVSTTLGHPFLICDEDISVGHPSPLFQNGTVSEKLFGEFLPSYIQIKYLISFDMIKGQIYKSVFSRNDVCSDSDREHLVADLKKKANEWFKDVDQSCRQYYLRTRTRQLSSPLLHLELYYHILMSLIFRPSPLFPTVPEKHLATLIHAVQQKVKLSLDLINSGTLSWNWILLYRTLEDSALLIYCHCKSSTETRLDQYLGAVVNILERYPTVWSAAHRVSSSLKKILGALAVGDILRVNADIRHFMIAEYGHGSIHSVQDWHASNIQRKSQLMVDYLEGLVDSP